MAGKSKGKGVRNSRSLRFLFASGILRGSGSGKDRSVSYNAKRAKSIAGQRKRGVDVTRKYRNTPKGSTRPVIGGSKAAGLRGGGGGGLKSGMAKADHSSTRAARIAAGNKQLEKFAGRQAAGYKARLTPAGEPHTASKNAFGKYADSKKPYRRGSQGFLINGDLHERQHRPGIVGKYGRTGAGDRATRTPAVNRADAIQRASARAVAVGAAQQRGRAFINRRDGKSLDASAATRRATTARELRAALKDTGIKAMPSARQLRVSASRQKLAAALRGYRTQSPTLAREKLLKLKTEPQYAKNLRNPFRTRKG